MKVLKRRAGGSWCGFSTLVKCSCSDFGAVLDDERKAARKRNYFIAVLVVVMRASMAKVSTRAAAGLPDRRRE